MKKISELRLIDKQSLCLDTELVFADRFVQIITDDDESDSFTLTIERADQIIAWLKEWKKQEGGE